MDITSYLLGKQAGGGSTPTLQTKSVTITENTTTEVTPDTGYDGLSSVEVTTNVPTGGTVEEKDVDFIDYDGTLLHSYTKAEFLALAEMPTNPTHDGLTAQGWNWDLTDAKDYVTNYGMLVIGQTYITDDGSTRLYIDLQNGLKTPTVDIIVNGTVTIDWGDNTAVNTLSSTGSSVHQTHTYANEGKYVISILPTENSQFYFYGQQAYLTNILREWNSASPNNSQFYLNSIYKIELGNNVGINNFGLQSLANLETITIPNGILNMGTTRGASPITESYALKSLTFPKTLTNYVASLENYSLESISIPKIATVGTIRANYNLQKITIPTDSYAIFINCRKLKDVVIPENITSIRDNAFDSCVRIKKIIMPSTITSIGASAFRYCYGLEIIDFSKNLVIPSVSNSNAWTGLNNCKIIVPDSLYDNWKTTTNWTQTAFRIVKASEA